MKQKLRKKYKAPKMKVVELKTRDRLLLEDSVIDFVIN